MLLSSLPLDVSLERAQLVVPVRLELIEPRLERDDRLGSEAEDPNPGVLGYAFVGDDPGFEEHAQMLAHCRCRQTGRLGEFPGTPGADAQELHDAETSRVRQRLEQWCQLGSTICSHEDNSYLDQ